VHSDEIKGEKSKIKKKDYAKASIMGAIGSGIKSLFGG